MIFAELFICFFRTGLFTIGGGLAAIPLLQDAVVKTGWINEAEFFDMFAVSQSTPGPIGINMATYIGFKLAGIPGALVATFAMVLPSLIIIILIAKFMATFNRNPYVQSALQGLRPAAVGLIATALFVVFTRSVIRLDLAAQGGSWFHLESLAIFAVLVPCRAKWRKIHPLAFLAAGAAAGMVLL